MISHMIGMQTDQIRESITLTHQSSSAKPKSSLNINPTIKPKIEEYHVFYWKGDTHPIDVKLSSHVSTIENLINEAITVLNLEHQLGLDADSRNYRLYAAKKTGKKKSDFPSFDHLQIVQKTKVQSFCLQPKNPPASYEVTVSSAPTLLTEPIKELKDEKSISGSYDLYTKQGLATRKKSEVLPDRNSGGCFCWSSAKPRK